MSANRRQFLQAIGGLTAVGATLPAAEALASSAHSHPNEDSLGVLVDLTLCVGCRHCEYACRKQDATVQQQRRRQRLRQRDGGTSTEALAADLGIGTLETYEDKSGFATRRRPSPEALTVVNASDQPNLGQMTGSTRGNAEPLYAKINCVHCNHPACVSACIVGALEKQPNGAVTYDAWKCMGCRYCLVACPLQLPAYEYHDAFTPEVRKCQFCHERTSQGQPPACVEACPRQAMTFGKRSDLVKLAHACIAEHPDKYVNHVYGEHEVGGTSWLYLSPVPFEELSDVGFLKLGTDAPPALTEAIQHGVFKYWIAPVALYGLLSAAFFVTRSRRVAASGAKAQVLAATAGDGGGDGCVGGKERHLDHAGQASHGEAAPLREKLLTPGVWALITLVLLGGVAMLYRFIVGIGATTNLDQQHPWGLWIAMDVGSGIALAGGGFVTAALVHIFHREHYHAIARSALLTALLGSRSGRPLLRHR